MGYLKKIEYEIVLKDSLSIIRGCSGCGKKAHFLNTKKFRVNANGNKLDVWLIYQCEECRHTLNLAIYERQKVSSIPKKEYRCFQDNDEQLAELYGKNMQLLRKNKADPDFERLHYDFVKRKEMTERGHSGEQILFTIRNPCELKIPPEKQIAAVLGWSRSQVKKLVEQGEIKVGTSSRQSVSFRVNAGVVLRISGPV
ncbi:MAG: DUF1062 domain-containing protein [Lachnospiraceae bacterium]|nr:DUF1062 domain-containing protein [Lachnospiraceae bacterium]